jgi:hypothetical protein
MTNSLQMSLKSSLSSQQAAQLAAAFKEKEEKIIQGMQERRK